LKAVIAGATGLVGGHLVSNLLKQEDTESILVVGRRSYESEDPRVRNVTTDFNELSALEFPDQAAWFCCLGTTIKKAGSREKFRKVDRDMVVAFAQEAFASQAESFHMVSAAGASRSSVFFYSRVKGETEEELMSLGLNATYIYQPSMILGDRKEYRLGEEIGKKLMALMKPVLVGGLKKYRGVQANDISLSMLRSAKHPDKGVHFSTYDMI
jgi:uncharacterized protein YbjT (DUF2867 family)